MSPHQQHMDTRRVASPSVSVVSNTPPWGQNRERRVMTWPAGRKLHAVCFYGLNK